jgi:hypothetical protein
MYAEKFGIAIAAKMPIMVTTISISIKVNPKLLRTGIA